MIWLLAAAIVLAASTLTFVYLHRASHDTRRERLPIGPTLGSTILVVDDDVHVRASFVRLLKSRGYAAVGAADGEEALAALQVLQIGLILLDLRMHGMDGWAFRVRQQDDPNLAKIPTIVVTGSMPDSELRARFGPAVIWFEKPFDIEEIFAVVRSLLHRPS